MGRPSKLTPEVVKRLTEAIRDGNYYEAACGYAGITYTTFRNWMIKGENAKSGKYREFFEAIMQAECEAEVRMVAQWQQHMPEDYRAIRDFLERRFPDRWGRKDKVQQEISGPDGGPIQWVDLVRLANDDDEPDKPDS
jgi:transposase